MKSTIIKRLSLCSVALLSSLTFSLAPMVRVFATSDFDNFYQSTGSVVGSSDYSGHTCDAVDVTSTWESYIRDSSKWRSGTDFSAAKSSLESALADNAHGAWGISQGLTATSSQKEPIIFWTQDSTAQLVWHNDVGNDGVYLETSGGSTIHWASIDCEDYIYGDSVHEEKLLFTGSTSSMEISTSTSPHFHVYKNLFVYNVPTNIPSGYVGDAVVTTSNAPAPIVGDIQCFNGDLHIGSVHITPSSGVAGDAALSDDGIGGRYYTYYPSEASSTYGLQVVCGGVTQYNDPAAPASTSITNYVWYCGPDEYWCTPE